MPTSQSVLCPSHYYVVDVRSVRPVWCGGSVKTVRLLVLPGWFWAVPSLQLSCVIASDYYLKHFSRLLWLKQLERQLLHEDRIIP